MKLDSCMDKKGWLVILVVILIAFGVWSYNQKNVGLDPPVNDERCDECANVCDPCRDKITECEALEDTCKDLAKACDKLDRECDYANRHCPSDIEEYCNSDDVHEDECAAARALCETLADCIRDNSVPNCEGTVEQCWTDHGDCETAQNDLCYRCGICMNDQGLDPEEDCLKKKVMLAR